MSDVQADVLNTFLRALAQRDVEAMIRCYTTTATYHSPIFPQVEGDTLTATWQWFCAKAPDLTMVVDEQAFEANTARVQWTATYTFPKTGRPVVQVTDSIFVFEGPQLCRHEDRFDLHRWSHMALGPLGRVLGGRRWLQRSLQRAAAERVARFQERQRQPPHDPRR